MALRDSADSHQVAPKARSGRFREVPTAGEQLETRVLLRHIDEPGLHRIENYEQLGGYTALKRAFRDLHERGEPPARGAYAERWRQEVEPIVGAFARELEPARLDLLRRAVAGGLR